MTAGRSTYRRTKRTALAVAAAATLTFVATDPGAAAPAAETFNNGTGSATALGYKVNPTNGNLSFGVTFGEAIAGHQNTAATGQSRAVNLGVIGVTLAGEACDGGAPTWAEEDQPHPVIARSGEEGAEAGKSEFEQGLPGGIKKYARATTAPFAEAVTTIAPFGDPDAFYVSGGRTITHSGVVQGNVREALARTELGTIDIAGGAIRLKGLTWEAIHRSGAVDETIGTFNIGSIEIGGQAQAMPGDGAQQLAALNVLLAPLGLDLTPPLVRVEQGIVFVDPLTIGIVPSQQRDQIAGQIVSGLQPLRESIADALLAQDCGNATYITIADIGIGSISGAGALGLELGGVQATTADFSIFEFGKIPPLLDLPPAFDELPATVLDTFTTPSNVRAPATGAPTETAGAPPERETVPTKPIADLSGSRGGLLALIGGGGLALLAATAEADRRKMQRALREIPLEA